MLTNAATACERRQNRIALAPGAQLIQRTAALAL